MSYLQVCDITKRFGAQTALDNVSVEVEKGELVCILGPSGCGKTTLLRIIAGLETPDAGNVFIARKDCTFLPPAKRNFGIVFQSYALFPNMTVWQNILFGLRQKKSMDRDAMDIRASEVLRMVDLMEHKDKYPSQLSGGQQQRTALARALALSPAYLLLDEPLSALDAKVRTKLRGEIRNIQKTLGITTIMVTHDQEEAITMADKIIVMSDAAVRQVGTPREIYDRPASPFVAEFIGTMNFYEQGGQLCAVRPEKVALCGRKSDYDLSARIKSLEYKGAMTRIHATLLAGAGRDDFVVDLLSEQAEHMMLLENSIIFLSAPEDAVIRYPALAVG